MLIDLLDHDKGSHGISGIYFKYDVSALSISVKQDRENFIHFFVRLCSVIAGIIVISGACVCVLQNDDIIIIIFSDENYMFHLRKYQKLKPKKTFCFFFLGFINTFLQYVFNTLLQKFAPQLYERFSDIDKANAAAAPAPDPIPQPAKPTSAPNALLQNAQQMADVKFDFSVL